MRPVGASTPNVLCLHLPLISSALSASLRYTPHKKALRFTEGLKHILNFRALDKHQSRLFRTVSRPRAKFDHTRVATGTVFVAGANLIEQPSYRLFIL